MARVFISYSSTDRENGIRQLVTDLRAAGHDVWVDYEAITGREAYWDEIQAGIEACTHFVFCISPVSISKGNGARKELFHAAGLKPMPTIVPIMIQPTPYDDLPMLISPGEFQIHDIAKFGYAATLPKILRAVNNEDRAPASDKQKRSVSQSDSTEPQPAQPDRRLPIIIAVLVVALIIVGLIGIVPSLINQSKPTPTLISTREDTPVAAVADALTQTFTAQTAIALASSPTNILTSTKIPSATTTPTPKSTNTPLSIDDFIAQTQASWDKATANVIASFTKTPTQTFTPTSTSTNTPDVQKTIEAAFSLTAQQNTAIAVSSFTKTPTPTNTPTYTSTSTNTNTPTFTPTFTSSYTPSNTLTLTPTSTYTSTSTNTSTPTFTSTFTSTYTPSNTLIPTITPTYTTTKVFSNAAWVPVERLFNGVPMVLVPSGCFNMGSTTAEIDAFNKQYNTDSFKDEGPQSPICFDAPFWIDKMEVTNAQFKQLNGQARNQSKWTSNLRPRENITWSEAQDFCILRGGRLPTEAEWEYASRGPDGLTYPWGNTFELNNAVYNYNSFLTANVGSKPSGASWVGALDLSGNVWEWTSSLYKDYPYVATDGRESNDDANSDRVLRGGSWGYLVTFVLRGAYRTNNAPSSSLSDVGFRCKLS